MKRNASPPPPADRAARERFVNELDRNFSVIAPAGVGKTKAIVDRVVAIATGDAERARAWLPKLVVVTYTNKAADEMYQRARNAIIEKRVGLPILTQFNRAFFGTIHSFCVRLLRSHGHLCGLPTQFEPVENDDDLWQEFVRQLDQLAPQLPAPFVEAVTRLMPMDTLLKLARGLDAGVSLPADTDVGSAPRVDLSGVLAQTADGRSAATIARSQQAAREWLEAWQGGHGFAPLPRAATKAKDFVESWERAFGPLREWLGSAALHVARAIGLAYRDFRRTRGSLTYDDQVELAWELVRDPEAGRRLRGEQYRLILDEAQDTDPLQFRILLELARPRDARGTWLDTGGAPPEPGRFCLVGDPQQSIYGQRADLACYARIREQLAQDRSADELVFSVTFRCDAAIIAAVNGLVRPMFESSPGQVTYHPLQARPAAGPGRVMRWTPRAPGDEDQGVETRTLAEGRQLARWLKETGFAALGATSWSGVAVLCPRTRWLQTLAEGLREEGLASQIHSERAVQADDPVYAWFTALVNVLARPDDGFEVVGVLRELYGLTDEALARFAARHENPWSLRAAPDPNAASAREAVADPIAGVLDFLRALRAEIAALPLRDAARRAVEAVSLRERLEALALPELLVDDPLESLLVRAAEAESDGASLAEFAETLRDGMADAVPARPVARDAVQLLTCHKAKGLQWEVVILPLMFRAIGEPSEYPVLIRSGPGAPPQIALSSHDLRPMQEKVEQRRRQELQRLLYVALTRAQRTLVVADDDRLFPRKKLNRSFADLLGMLGEDGSRIFNETWNGLDDHVRPGAPPAPAPAAQRAAERDDLTAGQVRDAVARAAGAPRRILPYQLGEAEAQAEMAIAAPETGRSAGAEAARAYGIWWHETIERLDWKGTQAARDRYWREALARCPDPARGRAEGALLAASATAQRLAAPGLVIRREVPILWRRAPGECVEGIVDLAAWDAAARRWLVADWKTNVVTETGSDHLRAIYEPQLRAYAEALRAISGAGVEAGVYATATGAWIPCAAIP